MQILKLNEGDILELKKPHPCGNKLFKVLRVGSVVRIVCCECSRDMTLDRIKLEKAVKQIITQSTPGSERIKNNEQKNENVAK